MVVRNLQHRIRLVEICFIILAVSLLSSCSDAGLIDTPRVIDTLSITRTIVRSVDVTADVSYMATVNGSSSFIETDPGTSIVLHRMSDSTWSFEATINASNRSQVPFLPVDVMQLSLITSPLPADTTDVAVRTAIAHAASSEPAATVTLFSAVSSPVDFKDSTRVRIRVTRSALSEQRTLNDIHITRTYDRFSVSDDTVLVPWDVFDIRDLELAVDTSYAITTFHTGTQSVIERTTIEPPLFASQPVACSITASTTTQPGKIMATLRVPATGNSALTSLLGTQGSIDLTLMIPIP